jgi:hypothetical protein
MNSCPFPRRCLAHLALAAMLLPFGSSFAQEKRDEAATQRAAGFLQSVAESMRAETSDKQIAVRQSPLLKYSDPARGYLAAGVWRLGETGRPAALVSLQYSLRPQIDHPVLDYELISLSGARFNVKSRSVTLPADGTAPKFVPLEGVEKPAATEKQRLIQLRALARRFNVSEKLGDDVATLRFLPQPIDRYEDKKHGIIDGALFAFAYGTNPEAILALECDEEGWRYALARMAWAEVVVERDGKEVARFEQLSASPIGGSYRTAGEPIEKEAK